MQTVDILRETHEQKYHTVLRKLLEKIYENI